MLILLKISNKHISDAYSIMGTWLVCVDIYKRKFHQKGSAPDYSLVFLSLNL